MDNRLLLLVHAGAPSTRQYDARYICQAKTYLGVCSSRSKRGRQEADAAADQALQSSHSTSVPIEDGDGRIPSVARSSNVSIYLEDTQLAYTALESQLRSSARPVAVGSAVEATEADNLSGSIGRDSSRKRSLSQSSYLVSPFLERPRQPKQRRTEVSVHLVAPTHRLRDPSVDPNGGHLGVVATGATQQGIPARTDVQNVETTSELPSSYSLSTERSSNRPSLPEKSISDPGPLPANRVEISSGRPRRSPLTNSTAIENSARGACEYQSIKASSARVFSPTARIDAGENGSRPPGLQKTSAEILPPSPDTSMQSFQSHITPALRHLAENSAVAAVFNPVSQERPLEASERGHWLLKCQEWSFNEQLAFWEHLERSIGTAGWGVWCSRGTDHQLQKSTDRSGHPPGEDTSFAPVRVWCWGEVARHIYLLLYVASGSKVRRLGLEWIDSQGDVIIKMR